MICLSSCDKTTPAHLMAAARLNVPTTLLTCGYQIGGICHSTNEFVDIDDVYESIGAVECGHMSVEELTDMTEAAIQTPGVCAGLGTANSMHIIAEAIGMSLPGNSPVLANSRRLYEFAQKAGERIVDLVNNNILPRDIMTKEAVENAIMVTLAVGGSVNTVRHLSAVATEAELDMDVVATYERLADQIPLLTAVRPNGPYRTEDLEVAGGTKAVMKRLESYLHLDALTASGKSVRENIQDGFVKNEEVIRTLESPQSHKPGIAILRGNLAPDGSIVKLSAVPDEIERFVGPANIFETEDEAIKALGNGKIQKGDIVVLRNMGPVGGPGTVFAASFVAALNGAGIAQYVAVITDGELSGLNRGIIVGQLMPEAAVGGPLAVIEQGETINIDLVNRKIILDIPAHELEKRLVEWRPLERDLDANYLSQYAQLVQPISQGAVLGKRKHLDAKNKETKESTKVTKS
jgi:dihydroxy-acid dehydratase